MIEFVDMSSLYAFSDPLPASQVQHGDAFMPLTELFPQGFAMAEYRYGGMGGWLSDLLGKKKNRPPPPPSAEAIQAQAAAQQALLAQQARAEQERREWTTKIVKIGAGIAVAGLLVRLVRG